MNDLIRHSCAAAIAIAAVAIVGRGALAQDERLPEIVAVNVGFNGLYKLGVWTPVQITLRGGGRPQEGAVRLTTPDGEGVPTSVASQRPVALLPGQDSVVRLHTRFGREDELRIVFEPGDNQGAGVSKRLEAGSDDARFRFHSAVDAQFKLMVSVGAGLGADGLATDSGGMPRSDLFVASLNDVADLPDRWYDYEGVDTLLVAGSNPQDFKRLAADGAQIQAIDDWVSQGGRLFFTAGTEAQRILGRDQPWARFAPGEVVDVRPLLSTGALEAYTGEGFPSIEFNPPIVALLRDPRGKTVLAERGLPLVVRTPRGFGETVFVAADLDLPPFNAWPGRRRLLEKLLQEARESSDDDAANTSIGSMYGMVDMASQLRAALDNFTGVKPAPFALVGGLVFLYILAIGPGDYFLLKKVLLKMELTWVTFPLLAGGFCALAYVLAYEFKGRNLHVNQVDIVDVDLESGAVRGATWANVFSPASRAFDLTVEPALGDKEGQPGGMPTPANDDPPEVLFGWMGTPGEALGGMRSGGGGSRLFSRDYAFKADLSAMQGVAIPVWSSRSFTSRWRYRGTTGLVASLKATTTDVLEGTITMPPDLDLSNCLLAYGNFAYNLDDMRPGEIRKISRGDETGLSEFLKRVQAESGGELAAPFSRRGSRFDQAGLDVFPIVRRMMFYDAADGERNAGFLNGYQHFVDLSARLDLGRAVLTGMARASKPAAQLLDDGQPLGGDEDRHWVFFRFLIPVDQTALKPASETAPQPVPSPPPVDGPPAAPLDPSGPVEPAAEPVRIEAKAPQPAAPAP